MPYFCPQAFTFSTRLQQTTISGAFFLENEGLISVAVADHSFKNQLLVTLFFMK